MFARFSLVALVAASYSAQRAVGARQGYPQHIKDLIEGSEAQNLKSESVDEAVSNQLVREDATVEAAHSQAKKDAGAHEPASGLKRMVMDIGGGTGASVSGTGDSSIDRGLLRRMKHQDKAVMLLLLLAYMGSLLFSACVAYKQAHNNSPVTYYADPRFHNLTMENEDARSFLEAFNLNPGDAQLQVTGLKPLGPVPDYVVDRVVEWLGVRYRVAFSFVLDLSPWLMPLGSSVPGGNQDEWCAGVAQDDIERLQGYLVTDKNELSYVHLTKQVEWKDWEELATNIKSKIRQGGFTGVIRVDRRCDEVVEVHKNKQWANFMHSRTTKVLVALSLVGWFIYLPYMWVRNKVAITIPCRYKVDVGISQYWPLIQDKIGPNGFNHQAASQQ